MRYLFFISTATDITYNVNPSNNIYDGANENDPNKGIVEIEVEIDGYKCYDYKQQRAFTNTAAKIIINSALQLNIPGSLAECSYDCL